MDTVVNNNIVLQKLASLPFYTEGPAVDALNNYYCTTLTGGSILQIDINGQINEWATSACPNGQIIIPGGDHLVCDSLLGVVRRFDAKGKFVKNETATFIEGQKVEVPNDLIMDAKGNIYFTDSIRHTGRVYFISTDGQQSILASGLDYPNGILLSADETILYVAESYQNRIIQFKLDDAGVVTQPYTIFSNLPQNQSGKKEDNLPDGIALHHSGIFGVAHYGMQAVQILSKSGSLLYSIDTTMPCTSNLIFLADNRLLVTGGYGEPGPGALFAITVNDSIF